MLVYKSTNLVNNKVYIGITTRNFEKRIKEHINASIINDSSLVFHRAIRKYGEDNFKWEIIDYANTLEELNEKEKYWINFYNTCIFYKNCNGYNMTIGGEGTFGYKHSEENRQKLSELKKGVSISDSTNFTDEEILKIKELLKSNISQKDIAKMFNVTNEVISSIKRGRSWINIEEDISTIKYWNAKKLTKDDVLEIKQLIKSKIAYDEIAKKFNVASITIEQIKSGITWKDVGDDVSYVKYSLGRKAILTEKEVIEIKLLIKAKKMKLYEIAQKYDVKPRMVYDISSGVSWSHVTV